MNREALFKGIVEIVDPIDELTEQTEIAGSDDLDSITLFNVILFLKEQGATLTYSQLEDCKTLGDLLDLAQK